LTISAVSTPPPTGYNVPGMLTLLPGLGLFGTLLTTRKRKPFTRKSIRWMGLQGLLLVVSLLTLGCGSNSTTPTPPSQQTTVMVTGTAGSLSQTAAVTVSIN
jgi:hypothetical protein